MTRIPWGGVCARANTALTASASAPAPAPAVG